MFVMPIYNFPQIIVKIATDKPAKLIIFATKCLPASLLTFQLFGRQAVAKN